MKRTLSIFLVLLFTFQMVQSQIIDQLNEKSRQEMYNFYSFKSKKKKKTGLILLGSGLAATVAGIAIASNNFWEDDGGFAAGTGLFLIGSCATIASIPILIVSGASNRKAKGYMETGMSGDGNVNFENYRNVTVGLKIDY